MSARYTAKHIVSIGDGVVSLRSPTSSTVILARILGIEFSPLRVIYLDRKIHDASISAFGWEMTGAITTILREQSV